MAAVGGRGVGHEIALKDQSSPVGTLEVPCLVSIFIPHERRISMHPHQEHLRAFN